MKDIYKNPILYYILVPALVALWPLLVWAVYLPNAMDSLQDDLVDYVEAQETIGQILKLDPERLKLTDSKAAAAEFDYATSFNEIATSCGIAWANYNISSKPARVKNRQKTQNAVMVLNEVDVAKFARFLSSLQLRWANLQCEKVKLTKKEGLPDDWKINLDFKYYY
ncbi:MAG: hypothetical protein ACYS1A_12305 [Planctomycetota bacterium]|jgi:hypothetical protein